MSGASLAGPIADAAVNDLRAARDAVERDLLRIIVQLDTEKGSGELVRLQGQTAAAVYRQISDTLAQVQGEAIRIEGQRALEAVEAIVGAPPGGLPLDVRTELDQILDGQAADVVAVFKDAEKQMREAVARGVLSGGSLADVIQEVANINETTFLRASNAVDTAIMGVGRRAVMAEAEELEQYGIDLVYVYVGPRDNKNRPFCAQWVGKAVTQPSELDKQQGLPVQDFCGGYNCRHSWAPMPQEDAIATGYRVFTPDGQDITRQLSRALES